MENTGIGCVGSSLKGAGGAPSVFAIGARAGAGVGADAGRGACVAAGTGALAGVSPLACNNSSNDPSETLSPIFTRTSFIVPADGDGTSIVAFSDSNVINDSSAFTVWPGFTITSMTGTSLKSPMSGTFTSTIAPAYVVV